jgi:site-specific recombinase XerD
MRNDKALFFIYANEYLHKYIPLQRDMSKNTEKTYTDAMSLFRRYALDIHGLGVDKLTFERVGFDFMTGFTDWLKSPNNGKKGDSGATCNLRVSVIRSYVKFAMGKDAGLSSVWLALKGFPPVKTAKTVKDILNEQGLNALLCQPAGNTRIGLRDMTLMVLMYDSACRVSELLNLRKSDIMPDGPYPHVFVVGKGRKERCLPLMDRTIAYLKKYMSIFHNCPKTGTSFLFYTVIKGVAGPLSQDCLAKMLEKYAARARVACPEFPRRIHPHMFRRTRATHLYQQGYDIYTIARLLGHEQIETTKEYLNPSMEQLREAVENTCAKNEHGYAPSPEGYEAKRAILCGIR